MENAWAAGCCLMVMTILYLLYEKTKFDPAARKHAFVYKCLTTLCAAALAAYGTARDPSAGHILLLAGLLVCTAADGILEFHFLGGTAAFALGHLCYGAAYVLLAPPGMPSLSLFLLLAAVSVGVYPRLKHHAPQSALPYLGYALILSAMLALALPQKAVLLCGAALFVVSDGLLAVRILRKIPSVPYDYLCLGCYYLAQFLIATSTLG